MSEDVKKYFQILSADCPEWLNDYIATPEMQRLKGVSMSCGCDFLRMYNISRSYNTLEHSVAVALIVWHFTKDKVQTIAALFHDISSPAFKHCVEVMNGDALNQETIENSTYEVIKKSKSIRALLKRDRIRPKQVSDYHQFTIADNDTPRLSADRLEYSLTNAHKVDYFGVAMPLSTIRKFYNNLTIGKNGDGEEELAFLDYGVAKDFVKKICHLWPKWCDARYVITTETYSRFLKKAIKAKVFSYEELYQMTDKEAILAMRKSKNREIAQAIRKFMQVKRCYEGDNPPANRYVIKNYPVKRRYIDPLVCTDMKIEIKTGKIKFGYTRLSKCSPECLKIQKSFFAQENKQYSWLNTKIAL